MEKIPLGRSGLSSSRLIYGCMRICGDGTANALEKGSDALTAAWEAGFNHFDHANIYAGGACESLFGRWLKRHPGARADLIITSKCGIRFRGQPTPEAPARYDFSAGHIVEETEGSLQRLGVESLDMLLLHRPDYLFHPEEVAGALQKLHQSGKVKAFGVSNFRPSQVSLLAAASPQRIEAHQIQLNLHHIQPIEDGTLDQCLLEGCTPTFWCPLAGVAYPAWGNSFDKAIEDAIAAELHRQSEHYGEDATQIALAWLLKLPSLGAPIIGSTRPERIRASINALDIPYSREDWYRLLEARNGRKVP